jgi:anti-anti-sigma factor
MERATPTTLEVEPLQEPSVYALRGEIDLHTAPLVAEIPAHENDRLTLDFTHVTFVDSVGIWALVNLAEGCAALAIVNASDDVRRTFDLIDLSDATGIFID